MKKNNAISGVILFSFLCFSASPVHSQDDPALPPKPTGLAAKAGNGQVELTWDAPPSTAQIDFWEYGVKQVGGSFTWDTIPDSSDSTTSYTVTGLTNGITYRFKIRAKNAAGVGPASDRMSATPLGAPGVVDSLSAVSGDRKVVLFWAVPASDGGSAITGYQYQYSPDGSGWTAVSDATVTVSGLTNGTEYTFEVRAVNSVGEGAASSTSATPLGVPGAVGSLSAIAGNGQVTLAWDAPPSTAQIDFWEYGVKQVGGSFTWDTIPNSSASTTSYTVTGLTNGITYRFKIRAKNAAGVGPAPNKVSATPATVPSSVENLAATPSDGQVTLGWDAPSSDGGSAITGYEYQYSPGGSGWTAVSDVSATVSGLTNGTTYTFEVRAVNSVGEGPASTATATPATVPGAVGSLSATASDGKVVLGWDAPSSDGGSAITGYQYQYSPGGSGWTAVSDVSATVSGLTNGTTYTFEVRAVNSVGEGPASTATATPATVPGAVGSLSATASDGQVTLGWDAPSSDGGSAITGYQYQYSPGGNGWTAVADATVTVPGLTNGTEYTFEVRAVNSVGQGPTSSTSATPLGTPGAVGSLSATASDGKVTLSWNAPAADGGSAITGYQYQYSPSGSGWTAVSDVSATVSGLTNGTTYTFEVRAVNSVGEGPASTATATPATVPGAVGSLSAAASDGKVTLAWDAPTDDGGSAITGYEYQYSPSGSGWTAVSDVSATVSGLTNGTTYTFEVRAVNSVGEGPASTATATPATVPGAVGSLSATASDGKVVLGWDAPTDDGGSAITGYEYQYSPGGSGWTAVSDVSATVSGLTNGTTYTFEVRAVNSVGEGPASTATATPATVPGAVGSLSATASDGKVVLGWDAPSSDGGSAITGYQYQYSPGGSGWTAVSDVTVTVPGLTNGTEYTFQVRTVNSVGEGPASSTSATPATVSGAVGSLSATPGDGKVVLGWAAPASDGGSAITGYQYQYSPGGRGWTAVSDVTVTVSGLTNGTAYTFEVRAVNSVGQGPASGTSATPLGTPGAVGSLKATPGNGQVALSWAAPASDGGSAITGYQYQYSPGGSGWTAVTDVTVTVTDLTNGTAYTFEVRAVNSVGQGPASSTSATPLGTPGAVGSLKATPGNGQVALSWAAPASDGGSAITGYQYQYSPGGSGWTAVTDVTVTVSGLTNGTAYTFQVRAVNSVGQGPTSSTSATPATVPSVVGSLSAIPGDEKVVLSWATPASDGGSSITGYQYRRDEGDWEDVSGGATARSQAVSGLTNGTEYTFEVRAVNSVGQGPASTATATPMDMIAYYPFNGNAQDASGNGYHGTLSGPGPTTDRFGNKAGAILFNGTNHRINLPRAVLNGRTNVSVAFWLKTSKTGTQSIISGANQHNDNEYLIYFLSRNQVSFYSHGSGALGRHEDPKERCDVTIQSIADGNWHHFVVVRNASLGHADIFIDGTSYANRCRSLVYNKLVVDAGGLIIGQEQDRVGGSFDATQVFKGALDDLRIYNKALSATEVQALSRKRNPKKVAMREEPATSGLTLNFPNPFNASIQITYRLAASGPVRLEIYNALGQPVKTLVEEFQTVGSYQIHWDARDQRGAAVATGVYFTRLLYPGGAQVRRLLYIK